jgi:hypothetical protein
MSHRNGLTGIAALAAACCAMTCGGAAFAAASDAVTSPGASQLSLEPAALPQANAASAAPKYLDDTTTSAPAFTPWTLQGAIDKTPVGQFLDQYKLTINMFAEASYTYNFDKTPGLINYQRTFDIDREHLDLNQLDFQLARAVATSGNSYDVGGLIEMQYGTDARFLHSDGLNFYGSANPQFHPAQQWDLTQAYLNVYAPWGNGVTFTAGKFIALQGYEVISPTGNALFSHTYSFNFAIPFTNTGLLAKYQFNDDWALTLGFVRGWDQAFKAANGDALNVDGSLAWTPASIKGLTGYFNFISGPASPDIVPDHVNRYWRSVGEVILQYKWGDNWTFATDGVFGYEPHAGLNGKTANWYGDAVYATYMFDPHVSATVRGEYFSDNEDARGLGTDAYEVTAGLEITPFPTNEYLANLLIRPEVREDFSRSKIFDNGAKDHQGTLATDIIYKF